MENLKQDFLDSLLAEIPEEDLLEDTILNQIALRIQKIRINKGKSQSEFAKELKVSQPIISNWESGDCNFTISKLVKIMFSLGYDTVLDFKKHGINKNVFENSYSIKTTKVYDFGKAQSKVEKKITNDTCSASINYDRLYAIDKVG